MSALVVPALKRVISTLYGPKYLFVTNTVSSGVLMAVGDVAVQKIERFTNKENTNKGNDWARTRRLFTVGILLGPCNHVWYGFLDKVLPKKNALSVGKKILMDQTIAAPCLLFGFFMGTSLLERRPVKQSWEEFKEKFWTVYKADWMVWPAAQAINFCYVLPQYRVLYVTTVTLFWDAFLSHTKHKEIGHQKITAADS